MLASRAMRLSRLSSFCSLACVAAFPLTQAHAEPEPPLSTTNKAELVVAAAAQRTGQPPQIEGILPQSYNGAEFYVKLGETLRLTLRVNDPDGDPLSVRVVPLPAGATFDEESRTLVWTPNAVGDQALRFVASDGKLESSRTLLIRVARPEPPTVKRPPPPVLVEGERPTENYERSWESFLLPGVGYSVYSPRGAGIGTFSGINLEVVVAAWIHQNNNRGPSHGRVYVAAELLHGPSEQPILFTYSFGTSLSFERNPQRNWLIPHYGVDFGGSISDTLGSHFQTTPYLGLHAYASPNFFGSLRGGYRLLPGELERLGGLHLSAAVDFSIW